MSKTITVYTFDELSDEAKERAMRTLPKPDCQYTLNECVASLKALCKHAGVALKDWSLGPEGYRSFVKVEIGNSVSGDEPEALTGPRAFAWIENNIFGPLRQPWPLRAKGRKYTRPGHVPACPLTGVCFDEDLLDVFRDRDPRITIKDRFRSLADVIARICESELEYQASDEYRKEYADSYFDGATFTEDGRRVS